MTCRQPNTFSYQLRPARGEAGFLMVEAIVGVALIGMCAGIVMAAVVAVSHQTAARPAAAAALASTAQNIVTDLRAATAYDGAQIAQLIGRSTAFDVTENDAAGLPHTLHVVAAVTAGELDGAAVVSVTVRNAAGTAASVQATLVQEAPAPRSIVPAFTPAPQVLRLGDAPR